jgi:hypothetical protein
VRTQRGITLVETLIACVLASMLLVLVYSLMGLFFGNRGHSNVTALTRRSFLQKDAKSGVRRLLYRLRESIQILSPAPGTSADELVFRDITNVDIRVRHLPAENRVISERSVNGTWVPETGPVLISTSAGSIPASWPVMVSNCPSIRFTAVAADCVTVQASLEWEGQLASLLTLIKLRNASQGF